jgi:alkylated DNA repair protein (DNA oxidative demethylase)
MTAVPALTIRPGLIHWPGFLDRAAQEALVTDIREVVRLAPLFEPRMPKTGAPFSVRMSNCGPLGWVSDVKGYRYQPMHPVTGAPWPAIPERLLAIWRHAAPDAPQPEACLINFYAGGAKMGLHQDRDEDDRETPVVSVSLGDSAIFRIGGLTRRDKTQSLRLDSGDVLAFGGPSRLVFHGIDRVLPGTSTLLPQGGRINLTLRRVSAPVPASPAPSGRPVA